MIQAADVYDIRSDSPRLNDRFLVDTNVWKFLVYGKATQQRTAVAAAYVNYLTACRKANSALLWSPLSYTELGHLIELTEMEIYNRTAATHLKCTDPKEFRTGTQTRATVVGEMKVAWAQVSSMGTALPTPTDANALAAAINLFENCPLDGYDVFYIHAMRAAGIDCVITDDVDFLYVPGLRIFTANGKALERAEKFRKKHTR